MPDPGHQLPQDAIEQFHAARFRAAMEQIRAALTGKSSDLLSYEEVRQRLGGLETTNRTLQDIPLDAIVGSLGRYMDFTRRFLPRVEEDEARWARVRAGADSLDGLPPIEVFQVGEAYFVRDGNHRVSVARDLGATHIEAYVTLVQTRVPLTPDVSPDDLIIKEQYAAFLAATGLAAAFPDIDLSMSGAGNYRTLERQIRRHQAWLAQEAGQVVAYPEAARLWYADVYWPVVQFVRRSGLLRDFPQRTETDLYVWMDAHRRDLARELGWDVDARTAVLDLADRQAPAPAERLRQLGQKLHDALTPAVLEAGPTVGAWRASWLATYRQDRLFSHILVAVDGQDAGWHALQQALRVAWREGGHIFGLHVVSSPAAVDGAAAQAIRAEFAARCRRAGIPGELTVTAGPVTGTICYRARWADLVVISLSHPPGPQPVDRLSSAFGQLLRRCPRPVLAVPRRPAGLERILLAYDGSPKAAEALYVAAYLAGQWQVALTVVVALERAVTAATADGAGGILAAHGVAAHMVVESGPAAPLIWRTAQERDCGLVVMGGYGLQPVMEIVMGSVVDEVLRTRSRPVLICR